LGIVTLTVPLSIVIVLAFRVFIDKRTRKTYSDSPSSTVLH
jgi:hypothetical protein